MKTYTPTVTEDHMKIMIAGASPVKKIKNMENEKFAKDSDSKLGKIKKAYQGQFSIQDRDSNTPHIKKVRVVSTLEYYLSD